MDRCAAAEDGREGDGEAPPDGGGAEKACDRTGYCGCRDFEGPPAFEGGLEGSPPSDWQFPVPRSHWSR